MRKIIFSLFFIGFTVLIPSETLAAELPAVEVVNSFDVPAAERVDGDILATSAKGLVRSKVSYDSAMFGVVALNSLAAYRNAAKSDTPVARTGVAFVNVTNLGGPIVKGDFITSSEIVGKGQKAIGSGYVVGSALTAFDGKSGSEVNFGGKIYKQGQIQVALRIEYAEISGPRTLKRLFDYLGAGLFSNIRNPSQFGQIVRYMAAGLIVLLCIVISLLAFGRSVPKAIEAIGRNPLARRSIYLSMAFTVVVMLALIGIGIAAAIVVLRV